MKNALPKMCLTLASIIFASNCFAYKPCGQTGFVNERIQDCMKNAQSDKNGWKLVTVTSKGHQVWQQPNGTIWGDKLEDNWTIDGHNEEIYPFALIPTSCSKIRDENGSLTATNFDAPTIEEYQLAESQGLRTVLPNVQWNFWTGTSKSDIEINPRNYAYTFHGKIGEISYDLKEYYYALRCITRNP